MIVGEKLTRCSDCGNTCLIRDHNAGELVCERCGLVVTSSLFDYGKEWRAFNSQQYEKRTRVGAPLTLTIHDTGLSTFISPKNRDFGGHGLNPDQRAQAYRLVKWQRRSKASSSSDRNLMFALTEMTKATDKLQLNIIQS
jgi:transcription initiation factor TFIIB